MLFLLAVQSENQGLKVRKKSVFVIGMLLILILLYFFIFIFQTGKGGIVHPPDCSFFFIELEYIAFGNGLDELSLILYI